MNDYCTTSTMPPRANPAAMTSAGIGGAPILLCDLFNRGSGGRRTIGGCRRMTICDGGGRVECGYQRGSGEMRRVILILKPPPTCSSNGHRAIPSDLSHYVESAVHGHD